MWTSGWQKHEYDGKGIQTNCLTDEVSGDTALNSLEQLEAAEEQAGRCRAAGTEAVKRRLRICQVTQRAMACAFCSK